MNTNSIRGFTAALIIVGLFAVQTVAKGASSTTPAKAQFAASVTAPGTDCVYADLGGYYYDGTYVDSLGATVTGDSRVGTSNYFFRSVVYTGTAATNIRGVYLDFKNVVTAPTQTTISDPNDSSGAQLHLGDSSGTLNFIPDLRILASSLFSSNATANGTSVIIPFSLQPEFTGNADFELDYATNVAVSAPSANVRVLSAGPNAVAALYVMKSNKKVLVGRFYLPFTLTVTKG